jgi:hypothetical protein
LRASRIVAAPAAFAWAIAEDSLAASQGTAMTTRAVVRALAAAGAVAKVATASMVPALPPAVLMNERTKPPESHRRRQPAEHFRGRDAATDIGCFRFLTSIDTIFSRPPLRRRAALLVGWRPDRVFFFACPARKLSLMP